VATSSGRGYTHGEAPPASTRSLALTLKPGWWFDAAAGEFVSARGARTRIADELPAGSRLVATAPAVAKLSPLQRSAPERELARHVRLLLPADADDEACLRLVQRWEAVERAARPPQVSLP
jgi:hypothetical protein